MDLESDGEEGVKQDHVSESGEETDEEGSEGNDLSNEEQELNEGGFGGGFGVSTSEDAGTDSMVKLTVLHVRSLRCTQ